MNSNWKKECNYWHKTDEFGKTINIIKVDGIEVEVSDEVYAVYADIGRKERYARERASKRQLSLEHAGEDGLPLFMLAVGIFSPSAESDYIESISEEEQYRQHMLLSEALARLTPDELALIRRLFQDGISPYELARLRGVSFQSIYKKRKRILIKLKKILENLEKQG